MHPKGKPTAEHKHLIHPKHKLYEIASSSSPKYLWIALLCVGAISILALVFTILNSANVWQFSSKHSGVDGATGPEGPQGPQGPVGPQGATGVAGPVGPLGPTGAVGPVGSNGATGAAGAAASNPVVSYATAPLVAGSVAPHSVVFRGALSAYATVIASSLPLNHSVSFLTVYFDGSTSALQTVSGFVKPGAIANCTWLSTFAILDNGTNSVSVVTVVPNLVSLNMSAMFNNPCGVLYSTYCTYLVVANCGNGTLSILNGTSLSVIGSINGTGKASALSIVSGQVIDLLDSGTGVLMQVDLVAMSLVNYTATSISSSSSSASVVSYNIPVPCVFDFRNQMMYFNGTFSSSYNNATASISSSGFGTITAPVSPYCSSVSNQTLFSAGIVYNYTSAQSVPILAGLSNGGLPYSFPDGSNRLAVWGTYNNVTAIYVLNMTSFTILQTFVVPNTTYELRPMALSADGSMLFAGSQTFNYIGCANLTNGTLTVMALPNSTATSYGQWVPSIIWNPNSGSSLWILLSVQAFYSTSLCPSYAAIYIMQWPSLTVTQNYSISPYLAVSLQLSPDNQTLMFTAMQFGCVSPSYTTFSKVFGLNATTLAVIYTVMPCATPQSSTTLVCSVINPATGLAYVTGDCGAPYGLQITSFYPTNGSIPTGGAYVGLFPNSGIQGYFLTQSTCASGLLSRYIVYTGSTGYAIIDTNTASTVETFVSFPSSASLTFNTNTLPYTAKGGSSGSGPIFCTAGNYIFFPYAAGPGQPSTGYVYSIFPPNNSNSAYFPSYLPGITAVGQSATLNALFVPNPANNSVSVLTSTGFLPITTLSAPIAAPGLISGTTMDETSVWVASINSSKVARIWTPSFGSTSYSFAPYTVSVGGIPSAMNVMTIPYLYTPTTSAAVLVSITSQMYSSLTSNYEGLVYGTGPFPFPNTPFPSASYPSATLFGPTSGGLPNVYLLPYQSPTLVATLKGLTLNVTYWFDVVLYNSQSSNAGFTAPPLVEFYFVPGSN